MANVVPSALPPSVLSPSLHSLLEELRASLVAGYFSPRGPLEHGQLAVCVRGVSTTNPPSLLPALPTPLQASSWPLLDFVPDERGGKPQPALE